LEVVLVQGVARSGAKGQAELGQHQDRCPLTALPSHSACLSERKLGREEDRGGGFRSFGLDSL